MIMHSDITRHLKNYRKISIGDSMLDLEETMKIYDWMRSETKEGQITVVLMMIASELHDMNNNLKKIASRITSDVI